MRFIGMIKSLFEIPRTVKVEKKDVTVKHSAYMVSALGMRVYWHPKSIMNQVASMIDSTAYLDSESFLRDVKRLIPNLICVDNLSRSSCPSFVTLDYHKGGLCVIVRRGRKTIAIDVLSIIDTKTPITRTSALRNKKSETIRKRIAHLLTSIKTLK